MARATLILALLLPLAWVAAPARAAALPGPLVSTQWLAERRHEVVLLDVRPERKAFTLRHIPGARFVPLGELRATRVVDGIEVPGLVADADAFGATMRQAGVDHDSAVVITYPDDAALFATRLYWTLRYYGHRQVAILDGGNGLWFHERRGFARGDADVRPGDFTAGAPDRRLIATKDEVRRASRSGDVQLLDARPLTHYLGTVKRSSVQRPGHIPGARFLPNSTIVDPTGGHTLVAPPVLSRVVRTLGADPARPTITYCNSGMMASLAWFALHEVLGNADTRLYDGSMLEWAADPRLAVESVTAD